MATCCALPPRSTSIRTLLLRRSCSYYKCKNDATHLNTVTATVNATEVTGGKDYTATVTAAASLDHAEHTSTKHVAHVHTLSGTPAVAATCTRDGNSAYWTCTDCGLYFADKEALQEIEEGSWVIPALGHDYQVMTSIIKASCERGGLEIVVCSHNPMHVKMQTVPATGHDWDEGVVTKAPTRWSTGIRTYTCRNNPTHRRTEVIPATGSGETPPAVPAFSWWNIFWWLRPHSRG